MDNIIINQTNATKPRKWGVFLLFATVPTLLCCALPILLVSLGLGSVVASIYGDYFPFLRWFGLNEGITFGIATVILIVSAWVIYRPGQQCPADPELAAACDNAKKWNRRFFWGAIVIYCVGVYSAYILPLTL